jgi:Dyp-type peroxidase family
MMDQSSIHDASASSSLGSIQSTNHPTLEEPLLSIHNIQGNILVGFNKDFQTLLFLEIVDAFLFKRWLKPWIPFVATTAEVLAFNRLFKQLRERRLGWPHTVKATWMNIAFSYKGLEKLVPKDVGMFKDQAFKDGLAARSASLGDPTDPNFEGCPDNWVIGGMPNEADVVMIFASDDCADLLAEVARVEASLYITDQGKSNRSGAQVIYKQHGAELPGPLYRHEHFGFRDGVSQPAIRGLISKDPDELLEPRRNPENTQSLPGQDLVWPGEFVFGYQGQDANKSVEEPGDHEVMEGPDWTRDGSFLVFRRLRQDVPAFHQFLLGVARKYGKGSNLEKGKALFGAKCVGRWTSGAPILSSPHQDNLDLGEDEMRNNDFEFKEDDQDGMICPFGAHIRKVYPRDDLEESIVQTHRMLRRGVPFGSPYPLSQDPNVKDSEERGLLFLAYQTSIEEQFEFVIKNLVNNPEASRSDAGYDPIIGQNGQSSGRERKFKFNFRGREEVITIEKEWVIPTGGGYFFAPSIQALEEKLGCCDLETQGTYLENPKLNDQGWKVTHPTLQIGSQRGDNKNMNNRIVELLDDPNEINYFITDIEQLHSKEKVIILLLYLHDN